MKHLIVLILLSLTYYAQSTIVLDTLFINKDTATVTGFNYQFCVFNDSSDFKLVNHTFEISSNDTLQLHIINNDTLDHTFQIDGVLETANNVNALSFGDFQIVLPSDGAFRYYSSVPYGHLLGASGVIIKGFQNYPVYCWNMFDQSDTLSYEIAETTTGSTPLDYMPNLFSINLKTHPSLEFDTLAKIVQQVGDTIYIATINSGQMEHTLHYHGFHVTIIDASVNTIMNNWKKDSYPLKKGEVVFVQLVADQPGIYPVHEHNLINVTNSGVYPGGMLNLIEIQP
ncbi:MAG: multicopper oxidase domain-containing protein [Crocinitomicaceae bacterium]|nr:multicopper oxidase domain-containing protein [Crocinitomicaceae bacterium]